MEIFAKINMTDLSAVATYRIAISHGMQVTLVSGIQLMLNVAFYQLNWMLQATCTESSQPTSRLAFAEKLAKQNAVGVGRDQTS